jgi:hypothetical protein
MRRALLIDQRGQSLIQVLISIGLMGIIMLAFTSMMTIQQRETNALSEKLAAVDLQKTLSAVISDGSVCGYIMNNPTPLTFDATAVSSASPQEISLPASRPLYASFSPPNILGPIVAQIGHPPSSYSNNLIVNSIKLSIDGAPSPMPPPGPGATFKGSWLIGFDSTKLVRSLKPTAVSTILTVDTSSPTSAKVSGCKGGGGMNNQSICESLLGGVYNTSASPPCALQSGSGSNCTTPDPGCSQYCTDSGKSYPGTSVCSNGSWICIAPACPFVP